jgi:aminoglycoside 6'-N-acetyltransferase I
MVTCCVMAKPTKLAAIRTAKPGDARQVLHMFKTLWPDESGHAAHIRGLLTRTARSTQPLVLFVAEAAGKLVGFIEVGLRSHANGCDPIRRVGFLEGWYVAQGFRRQGVGAKLVVAAEKWCRAQGCREMASDTWANHRLSVAAHQALGYEVEGRYINFRKSL